MGSKENLPLPHRDGSEVEVLKQQLQECQKHLAQTLLQKEDLSKTCDSQAARIADMVSGLEEIQNWKAQAKQQLEQLYAQQSTDSDLLFKNEQFIEQFQTQQRLNEQLQADKKKFADALELANAKIRNLENSAGIHPENPEHVDDEYLSILTEIDELHSQLMTEQEEKEALLASQSSLQEELTQNKSECRQLQSSLKETESLLDEQENLTLQTQEKLEALEIELESLQSNRQELILKKTSLSESVNEWQQKHHAVEQQYQTAQNECQLLQSQLQNQIEQTGQMETQLAHSRQHQTSLQQTLENQEARLEELQLQNHTLQEKIQLKSQALEIAVETHKQLQGDLEQRNAQFEKERAAMQDEIQLLRAELEESTHCADELSLLVQEVNTENEELQQNIEQTTQQISQIQTRITQQQKENEELRLENTTLRQPAALLTKIQEERDAAQQRALSLEQSLMQERAVLNVTQQEIQKYHKMTSDLQEKVCKMTADAQLMKDAELHARQDLAKTHEQLAVVQKIRDSYHMDIESLQQRLAQSQAKIETISSQLHNRTVDLEAANQTILSLEQQIKKSHSSIVSGVNDADTTCTYPVINSPTPGFSRAKISIRELREELELRKQQNRQNRQQLSRANAELHLMQNSSKNQ